MSHVRTQLRNAVRTTLNAVPALTDRVQKNSRGRADQVRLPIVVVRTPIERSENLPDSRKERAQTITVEIVAGHTVPDDELDALCTLVEDALDGPAEGSAIAQLTSDVALVSTDIDFTRDDEIQIGSALLTFVATYYTALGDPESAL